MRHLVAVLLSTPLLILLPSAAADAAAEAAASCQGKTATIESTGGTVTGTDDDDVIVMTGPGTVSALGGDDTICLVGPGPDARNTPGGIALDAGWGADSVELLGVNWSSSEFTGTLGSGKDHLIVGSNEVTRVLGTIDGGLGRDGMVLAAHMLVTADLVGRNILVKESRDAFGGHSSVITPGFEDVVATAGRVVVGGNEANTSVTVNACYGYASGGAGNDRLTLSHSAISGVKVSCVHGRHAHFAGGAGNDRLTGLRWSDELVGGPGHDVAIGHGGRDRCVTERKQSCGR